MPAFVFPSSDGSLSPITKSVFVWVFCRRLSLAGVSLAHTYRGHSFRRGGANWAFQCGVLGELIQVFGTGHPRRIRVFWNLPCQQNCGSREQLVRH